MVHRAGFPLSFVLMRSVSVKDSGHGAPANIRVRLVPLRVHSGTLAQVTIRSPVLLDEPFDRHGLRSRAMTRRVASVAAFCVQLFASAALVGCSSSHHAAKAVSQGDHRRSPHNQRNNRTGGKLPAVSLPSSWRSRLQMACSQLPRLLSSRSHFRCSGWHSDLRLASHGREVP